MDLLRCLPSTVLLCFVSFACPLTAAAAPADPSPPPILGGGGGGNPAAGPEEKACQSRAVGDPCTMPNDAPGSCARETCSRLDYSGGSPPKATEEACVVCTPGAGPGSEPTPVLGGDGGSPGSGGASGGGNEGKQPPASSSRCTMEPGAPGLGGTGGLALFALFAGAGAVRRRRRVSRLAQ